jgi:conjugative transposon TraK protein
MDFKSLVNIKSSVSILKWVMIAVIVVSSITTVIAVKMSYDFAEAQRQKIYVLDEGKSLILALAQDANLNQEALIKASVKYFHESFFSFGASKESINYHTEKALKVADRSGYNLYNNLVESNFYNEMISAKVTEEIRIDSIVINVNSYPYSAFTYAKLYLSRTSSITERNLITKCNIRRTPRDDDNPYGYMLEAIEVIANEDIRTVSK